MVIDSHFHYIPQEYLEEIAKVDSGWQTKTEKRGEKTFLVHEQGWAYPLTPGLHDMEKRLNDMKKMKIDMSVVSVSPTLYYYWAEPKVGLEISRLVNNATYDLVKAHPDKFIGMGTVPLQNTEMSIQELRRCVRDLGFKSVQIGSNVEGIQYDDPRFLPFFQECNDLGVVVLMHPYYILAKEVFLKYYLLNLYGFPLDGAMACASLIFGGVLDKCPDLKVIFVHGAGFAPYLFGRMMHGYSVRTEPKVNGAKSPEKYLNQLYFDTMVYGDKQLRFLVDFAGADHVLLGTDYDFDMAETAPVDFVKNAGLSSEQQQMILEGNIRKLLGI